MANPAKSLEEKAKLGTLRADRMPAAPIIAQELFKVPKPPARYKDNKVATAQYKKIANFLLTEGRLRLPDLPLIELLADAWADYLEAAETIKDLKEKELFVKTQFNKVGQEYETLTQWYGIYKKSREDIQKLSAMLAITPESRSKIGMPSQQQGNPLSDIRSKLFSGSIN